MNDFNNKEKYFQNRNDVEKILSVTKKIIVTNSNSVEFHFNVKIGSENYTLTVPINKIRHTRFLQELPIAFEDEELFYRQLRKEILEKEFAEDEIQYRTNLNGLQKVKDNWVFVYSNGSIDKNGFNSKIYSGITGLYIPPNAVINLEKNKEVVKKLFQEYNHNSTVFYPLFLFNVMAITNRYFRIIGEPMFMKLTLWLDGTSGSGKTELAKTVGTYTFADEDLNSNIVSVTGNRKYVLERLCNSSGSVFVLDDVKGEKVRERRNSVRNITDDCLRSIYQGRMTDVFGKQSGIQLIDTCALITGEYMETEESQNARLIYLKVDGFLKDKNNSDTLRVLQKNPNWLTTVCCGYVQWLIGKMDDNTFQKELTEKLAEMRFREKEYIDINNGERLEENKHMLKMAYLLVGMYFKDIGLTIEFIDSFSKHAKLSIDEAYNNTFALLGGEELLINKALKEILKICEIRKARYEFNSQYKDCGCRYRQDYFMLYDNDDFLYIEDYDESMARNIDGQHEQYDGRACVIIREEKLINLLQNMIRNMSNEYPIPYNVVERVIIHLPQLLKKMQIIYKQRRSDGNWGRTAVKYPVCETIEEFSGRFNAGFKEYWKVCIVDFKSVIQMNTEYPCMETLLERIEDTGMEKILPQIDTMRGTDERDMEESKIYRVRKAFMNGKSLYKE